MKITAKQLRRLIRKEYKNALRESKLAQALRVSDQEASGEGGSAAKAYDQIIAIFSRIKGLTASKRNNLRDKLQSFVKKIHKGGDLNSAAASVARYLKSVEIGMGMKGGGIPEAALKSLLGPNLDGKKGAVHNLGIFVQQLKKKK